PAARPPADLTTTSLVRLEQTGLRTWPSGLPDQEIPDEVSTEVDGMTVRGYPALVAGAARQAVAPVDLRVLAGPGERDHEHPRGVRELLLGELALATARVTSRWSPQQSLTLAASPYPSTAALVTDLQRCALQALCTEAGTPLTHVRTEARYRDLRATLRDTLEDRTAQVAAATADVLTAARDLDARLRSSTSLALLGTVADVRGQLDRLVGDGFVARSGQGRLRHLVRYLRAADVRLTKA
ncbi:DUF3418 domain-containing protein, partial [Cellulomonas bogoriensis]|uniref:DUF3418 domain-containing protein n=1 Tax=Cellulomonas bogoriensis TaxID=301388 RepID=UPI0005564518